MFFISCSFAKFQQAVKDFRDISMATLLAGGKPALFQRVSKGAGKNF
jgi:hypothetical protein